MTLDHAPSAYTHPAQWADDWLTPTERRALRAIESAPASYTPMRAQKSLSEAYSARQKRIRARRIQTVARVVTYLTIATLFVVACGYAIRIAYALYGN